MVSGFESNLVSAELYNCPHGTIVLQFGIVLVTMSIHELIQDACSQTGGGRVLFHQRCFFLVGVSATTPN